RPPGTPRRDRSSPPAAAPTPTRCQSQPSPHRLRPGSARWPRPTAPRHAQPPPPQGCSRAVPRTPATRPAEADPTRQLPAVVSFTIRGNASPDSSSWTAAAPANVDTTDASDSLLDSYWNTCRSPMPWFVAVALLVAPRGITGIRDANTNPDRWYATAVPASSRLDSTTVNPRHRPMTAFRNASALPAASTRLNSSKFKISDANSG